MKHGLFFLATLLAFGASPAFAAETAKPVEVATVTIPDCTGKNSPLEVLAGSCKLVKGVMIYGDLTSIPTDIAIVPSGASGVSGGL